MDQAPSEILKQLADKAVEQDRLARSKSDGASFYAARKEAYISAMWIVADVARMSASAVGLELNEATIRANKS